MSIPEISVVMSVYNGGSRLKETLDSITEQSFNDYEFIIVNDGSTDGSLDIIRDYAESDSRVKIVSHENMGLAGSLNKGVRLASGRYIARQDSGDVSHPARFERQLSYLKTNPQLKVLGTQFNYIANGKVLDTLRFPRTYEEIRQALPNYCCILHGSAMFDKDAFLDVGGYRKEYRCAQDYELWMRFTASYPAENLQEILYDYHIETTSTTFTRLVDQVHYAQLARLLHFYGQIGADRIRNEYLHSDKEIRLGYLHWANVVLSQDKALSLRLLEEVLADRYSPAAIMGKFYLKMGMLDRAAKLSYKMLT